MFPHAPCTGAFVLIAVGHILCEMHELWSHEFSLHCVVDRSLDFPSSRLCTLAMERIKAGVDDGKFFDSD